MNFTLRSISWSYIFGYFTGQTSPFRTYQNMFMERYGREFYGGVIELGGERHYKHERFFPNAGHYLYTNIDRDYDRYIDITDMKDQGDDSQDGYVCVSMLEHVFDFRLALAEIYRTLKPGGKLLLVVPFAYPIHDKVDYWRLAKDAYGHLLSGYKIVVFVPFGGMFSTMANALQKPRKNLALRYLIYKTVGFLALVVGKFMEIDDGFPLGYAVYAVKE